MIAILKTRCGCEQRIRVGGKPKYIEMALMETTEEFPPPRAMMANEFRPLIKRTFVLYGEDDGHPVYLEEWPDDKKRKEG